MCMRILRKNVSQCNIYAGYSYSKKKSESHFHAGLDQLNLLISIMGIFTFKQITFNTEFLTTKVMIYFILYFHLFHSWNHTPNKIFQSKFQCREIVTICLKGFFGLFWSEL